jgi:hypothetical protein
MKENEQPTPRVAIYGRIMAEIVAKHAGTPTKIFLGHNEWSELITLCSLWGAEWKGGKPTYDPTFEESDRAEFSGCKIYRVDAQEFLHVF